MTRLSSFMTLIFAAAVLAGCDGGGSPESSAENAPATEQTGTATTDTTTTGATDSGEIKKPAETD